MSQVAAIVPGIESMSNVMGTVATEAARVCAFALILRKLITKDRFYRKDRETRVAMLQGVMDEIANVYGVRVPPARKPHILEALVAAKGVYWANAVYALASPALYIKNIANLRSNNAYADLILPYVGEVNAQEMSVEEMMEAWKNVMTQFMGSCNNTATAQYLASVVAGNVALSEFYNGLVPPEHQIEVYDEDAVPAQPEVEEQALPGGGYSDEEHPIADDEEAQFNAEHGEDGQQ